MAKVEIGHSKLEAVNHMLAAVGLLRVGELPDPADASEESRAEYILDHWTRQVQAEGWADNMRHTSYAGNDATPVEVGTDVLRIECIAPGRYAGNISLIGNTLYCVTEDTANIPSSLTLFFHEWVEIAWEDCTQTLKDRILAAATEDYVARVKQRPEVLQRVLEKQLSLADRAAQRPDFRDEGVPPNTSPSMIAPQSSGR